MKLTGPVTEDDALLPKLITGELRVKNQEGLREALA